MTLTLPLGRLALSVELRVKPYQRQTARSGVRLSGGREHEYRPPHRSIDRLERAAADAMRAEAFVQLVNHRLV